MKFTTLSLARSLSVCGALLVVAGAAHGTAQFSGKPESHIDPATGHVKICFKETGLKKPTTYTAKAAVTASYACRNRGGNCPPGQDTVVKDTVAVSATYSPDKYGSVAACIVLKVPKPQGSPCPDEMALVLESVSWASISVTDVTSEIGPVYATPYKQAVNYGSCPKR